MNGGIHAANQPHVAVIGAGYAGVAAAIRLSEANIRVSVFESARTAGGRARAISHQGLTLDNGQHMLIGAYGRLLALMKLVEVGESGLLRLPMHMHMHPDVRLSTPHWPAPLHLAWGLISAHGLTWEDRRAATRLSSVVRKDSLPPELDGATVAAMLAATRQTKKLVRAIWLPLCVAALNTPIERASAKVFANVLRDALFHRREHSDFLLPRVDLSSLFPQPALDWLAARGGRVHLGERVRLINGDFRSFRLSTGAAAPDDRENEVFDAVICAVGPHQIEDLAGDAALHLPVGRPEKFEPICTVYLAFQSAIPMPSHMVGRQHGMTQWYFDRSRLGGPAGLIAAVISASGPHQQLSQSELAQIARTELEEIVGSLPPLLWSKVITERFATFACTPDVARPPVRTTLPGLYVAGDYTEGPYPATLEGAVRSGEAAAAAVLSDLHR